MFRSEFLSSRERDEQLRDPCALRRRQDHSRQGRQHRHLHRSNKVQIHIVLAGHIHKPGILIFNTVNTF